MHAVFVLIDCPLLDTNNAVQVQFTRKLQESSNNYMYIVHACPHAKNIEHFSIQCGSGCACGPGAETWSRLNIIPHVPIFTHAYARAYADCVYMDSRPNLDTTGPSFFFLSSQVLILTIGSIFVCDIILNYSIINRNF